MLSFSSVVVIITSSFFATVDNSSLFTCIVAFEVGSINFICFFTMLLDMILSCNVPSILISFCIDIAFFISSFV